MFSNSKKTHDFYVTTRGEFMIKILFFFAINVARDNCHYRVTPVVRGRAHCLLSNRQLALHAFVLQRDWFGCVGSGWTYSGLGAWE